MGAWSFGLGNQRLPVVMLATLLICVPLGLETGMLWDMRVVKHRKRLPQEVVKPPSLEIFKSRLEKHLDELI